MNIGITGVTGHLGNKIYNYCQANKKNDDTIISLSHSPLPNPQNRTIDYMDLTSLNSNFFNLDILIYIPSKNSNPQERVLELENILSAMENNNINKLIYIGFFGDQENNPFLLSPYLAYASRRVINHPVIKGIVVKNALFADPLVPYLDDISDMKKIVYPIKNEKLSFISSNDSAKAISQLCLNFDYWIAQNQKIYTLTSTINYSMQKLAQIASNITNTQIIYSPVSLKKFAQMYKNDNGELLASMYAGGGLGLLNTITDDYYKITGNQPLDLEQYLTKEYKKRLDLND